MNVKIIICCLFDQSVVLYFNNIEYNIVHMLGHNKGIDEILKQDPHFDLAENQLAEEVKVKIAETRASLLLDQPFFGYLLGQFEIYPTNDIDTYASDEQYVYVNPSYMDDLIRNNYNWKGKIKPKLMHLVLHLIYRHVRRGANKHPQLWAFAADIAVYQALRAVREDWMAPMDWELPTLGDIPDELQNKSADDIYQTLLNNYQKETSDSKSMSSNQSETEPSDQMEPESNRSGEQNTGAEQQRQHQPNDQELMQYAEEMRRKTGLESNECDINQVVEEEEIKSQAEEDISENMFEGMLRSAKNYSRHHGEIPEYVKRDIDKILEPQISWRTKLTQYLQKSITKDVTWSRPNKRLYGQGYYLPSNKRENINVILAVDTSGSISDDELSKFLADSRSIIQNIANVRLTVIDCDAEIQQIKTYESGESVLSHEFKGQGGTDFRPVFEKIKSIDADVLIYFTDGKGIFPKTPPYIPVIWTICSDVNPPFGEVVRYEL